MTPQKLVEVYLDQGNNMKDTLYISDMDTFYIYQKEGWYKALLEDDFARKIYLFIKKHYPKQRLSISFVRDLVKQMKWTILNRAKNLSWDYVCFKDGLLNTLTWELEPPSRSKITAFYLPFNYKTLPKEHPTLDKFLSTSLVTSGDLKPDTELISLVQEMLGDFLLPDIRTETAYFLVGNGANGKSILLKIDIKVFTFITGTSAIKYPYRMEITLAVKLAVSLILYSIDNVLIIIRNGLGFEWVGAFFHKVG